MPQKLKSLDSGAVSSLVSLRLLLQRGSDEAMSPTETSRRLALVTVDAAVEQAMRTAIHQLGLPAKPESSFHASLKTLQDRLSREWSQPGVRGVIELHEARNIARHMGILADARRFPGWVADAEAFIGSLVLRAFEIQLDDVALASSVRTVALRDLLTDAEAALDSGRFGDAFNLIEEAFIDVRNRWRQRRLTIPGMGLPDRVHDPSFGMSDDPIDSAEIQVFATAMAPYTQLLITRHNLVSNGPPPDYGEVHGSLVFVLDWILRWEIFEDGYPEERYAAYRSVFEPDRDDSGPSIAWVYPLRRWDATPDGRPRYHAAFQFRNVPDAMGSDWGVDLPLALKQLCEELDLGEAAITQQGVIQRGSCWFVFDQSVEPNLLHEVITRAIALADDWHEGRKQDDVRSPEEIRELDDSVNAQLAAHYTVGDVFGTVRFDTEATPEGRAYRGHLGFETDSPRDHNLAWGAFTNASGLVDDVRIHNNEINFRAYDISDQFAQRLGDAISVSESNILRHRNAESQAEEALADYADQMHSLFPEPPLPPAS